MYSKSSTISHRNSLWLNPFGFSVVEAGGIEPPAGFAPCPTEKVIDSPAKSTTFSAFPQADYLLKKSAIDPNNPKNRSVKGNPRKQ
jgi:hypothetical protein